MLANIEWRSRQEDQEVCTNIAATIIELEPPNVGLRMDIRHNRDAWCCHSVYRDTRAVIGYTDKEKEEEMQMRQELSRLFRLLKG